MIGMTAILDIAKPGDRILFVSFGSGAGSDAFSFVATERIAARQQNAPTTRRYVDRRTYIDYAVYARYREKYALN
jgi:hydroxymethylglutaryl-CoA synthase